MHLFAEIEPEAWGRLAGRLHPAVVHFPVALLLVAAAAEMLVAARRRDRPSRLALQCLAIGAAAAVVAAAMGWIGADAEPPGKSQATTLFLHRWIGVASAAGACVAVVLGVLARGGAKSRVRRGYRGVLLVAAMLVAAGGFFGGELVHGRGHVLAALRPAPEPAAASEPASAPGEEIVEEAPASVVVVDFDSHVLPILRTRCVECHGPNRSKGGLRVDRYDLLVENDWIVVPGDAAASALVQRVSLPADDPDLMPADGETLSRDEIEVLVAWIDAGAVGSGPERTASSERRTAEEPEPEPEPDMTRPALDDAQRRRRDDAIAGLIERGAAAGPIVAGGDSVEVNFAVAAAPVTDADLDLLSGLEPALERLNLSGAAITDAGVTRLAAFTTLRELRLDHTAVTDAAIDSLAALEHLERVNLFATPVTAEGVAALRADRAGLEVVGVPGSGNEDGLLP